MGIFEATVAAWTIFAYHKFKSETYDPLVLLIIFTVWTVIGYILYRKYAK